MSNVLVDADADLMSILNKIDVCEKFLSTCEPMFAWDGERIEELNKVRGYNAYKTSVLLNEMKALEDFVEIKIKEIESVHWRKYNENWQRSLSTRDIQAYISGEADYVAMKTLQLQIVNVKRQLESVENIIKSVSYDLKNITALRVAEIEDAIL